MAEVYTQVLASFVGLADGDSLEVDTPAGYRMVLRNIDAAAGSSVDIPRLHFEDLDTGATFILLYVGGLFLESVQWEGRQAFNEGGGFRITAENHAWDGRCTGFLLSL